MCKDKAICEAVCRAAKHFTSPDGSPVPIIGAANTFMESTCTAMGIPFMQEVIADLDYDENGDCVISRTHEAVDLYALKVKVREVLQSGKVLCRSKPGLLVDLKLSSAPLSLCIHSDTPKAAEVAGTVQSAVREFNQQLFGSSP